jgi:predicted nucleic acid-binding protein
MEEVKRAVLRAQHLLDSDSVAATFTASIERKCVDSGNKIARPHAFIAATLLRHGVTQLLTRDGNGFGDIAGLEVISY